jgi:hypothetical protein
MQNFGKEIILQVHIVKIILRVFYGDELWGFEVDGTASRSCRMADINIKVLDLPVLLSNSIV